MNATGRRKKRRRVASRRYIIRISIPTNYKGYAFPPKGGYNGAADDIAKRETGNGKRVSNAYLVQLRTYIVFYIFSRSSLYSRFRSRMYIDTGTGIRNNFYLNIYLVPRTSYLVPTAFEKNHENMKLFAWQWNETVHRCRRIRKPIYTATRSEEAHSLKSWPFLARRKVRVPT